MGRSWQTLNFKTNKICQQYSVLAFRTTHTMVFFSQANSKAPKVEQVFPYLVVTTTLFVFFVLFCFLLTHYEADLQLGKVQL